MQLSLLWRHQACRKGYRWETRTSGHEVPSLLQQQAGSGYPTPGFHPLGNNRKRQISKHGPCSFQLRCGALAANQKGFFFSPPQVSDAWEKLKNCRKTSLQEIPDELSDTLQKYWYLSLLFWHVLRGLWTGSSVVILYTLFSPFHLSQLIPAPAHLHVTVSSINFSVKKQARKAPLQWKPQNE